MADISSSIYSGSESSESSEAADPSSATPALKSRPGKRKVDTSGTPCKRATVSTQDNLSMHLSKLAIGDTTFVMKPEPNLIDLCEEKLQECKIGDKEPSLQAKHPSSLTESSSLPAKPPSSPAKPPMDCNKVTKNSIAKCTPLKVEPESTVASQAPAVAIPEDHTAPPVFPVFSRRNPRSNAKPKKPPVRRKLTTNFKKEKHDISDSTSKFPAIPAKKQSLMQNYFIKAGISSNEEE